MSIQAALQLFHMELALRKESRYFTPRLPAFRPSKEGNTRLNPGLTHKDNSKYSSGLSDVSRTMNGCRVSAKTGYIDMNSRPGRHRLLYVDGQALERQYCSKGHMGECASTTCHGVLLKLY